jgi:hypothetical protein
MTRLTTTRATSLFSTSRMSGKPDQRSSRGLRPFLAVVEPRRRYGITARRVP